MRRGWIILGSVLLLSGCGALLGPRAELHLPEGNDPASVGFRDGCNSSLGNIGSGMLQARPFSLDVNRGIEDKQYYEGYRTGANYCTYFLDAAPI